MSDSTWDDYAAEAISADVATSAPDLLPTVDAAATDAGQGDAASSWGDWNQEIADDAAVSASSEVAYADEAYASGFDAAGDAALSRAETSLDVADSHDATAGDYYSSAQGEYQSAADGYATAADGISATDSNDASTYDAAGVDSAAAPGTSSYVSDSDDAV